MSVFSVREVFEDHSLHRDTERGSDGLGWMGGGRRAAVVDRGALRASAKRGKEAPQDLHCEESRLRLLKARRTRMKAALCNRGSRFLRERQFQYIPSLIWHSPPPSPSLSHLCPPYYLACVDTLPPFCALLDPIPHAHRKSSIPSWMDIPNCPIFQGKPCPPVVGGIIR
jgi:hypothetical protein